MAWVKSAGPDQTAPSQANSADPDQMAPSWAVQTQIRLLLQSDLGLHCLPSTKFFKQSDLGLHCLPSTNFFKKQLHRSKF